MMFLSLEVQQMFVTMGGFSFQTWQEKWQFSLIIFILISIVCWYFLNFKKASARDFYISEANYTLSEANSGSLRLLTYNIAGLPQVISSATLPRAQSILKIGQNIGEFDIVNLQEDFNYNISLYRFNNHPFKTTTKGKVPFGDGLNTVSKYPILKLQRVPWRHCSGTDCLTPKGFAYMRVQVAKNVVVDVYNLHATSNFSTAALEARKQNLTQLAQYIGQHSAGQPLIVMGDFNAHYGLLGDNMHEFRKRTGLEDPWVQLHLKGTIPEPAERFAIPNKLELTNEVESIDKILYRNSDKLTFSPEQYAIEHDVFSTETGQPLSDHLAVSLRIKWDYKAE